jgi:hypothetical protein
MPARWSADKRLTIAMAKLIGEKLFFDASEDQSPTAFNSCQMI